MVTKARTEPRSFNQGLKESSFKDGRSGEAEVLSARLSMTLTGQDHVQQSYGPGVAHSFRSYPILVRTKLLLPVQPAATRPILLAGWILRVSCLRNFVSHIVTDTGTPMSTMIQCTFPWKWKTVCPGYYYFTNKFKRKASKSLRFAVIHSNDIALPNCEPKKALLENC